LPHQIGQSARASRRLPGVSGQPATLAKKPGISREGMIEAATDDLAFALRLADLADEIANTGFHARDYAVRTKDDGSSVTDVDVRVEEALVAQIETEYPRDGFLSEELGQVRTQGGTQRTWVVDGIDGTSAFIAGGPTWGTLIALVQDDEVKLGIASSPGLQRRWWASRGGGAWTGELTPSGFASESVRLAVSARRMKPRGSVLPPEGLLSGWRDQAVRRAASFLSPPGAPGHGPLLVAAGEIEVSVISPVGHGTTHPSLYSWKKPVASSAISGAADGSTLLPPSSRTDSRIVMSAPR
jgi:fructose-1,6-bisphosphatase/inositol monophosphatase family enzyme